MLWGSSDSNALGEFCPLSWDAPDAKNAITFGLVGWLIAACSFLQNRWHTEPKVCRLETITAETLTEEQALEQQKQETGKAEQETEGSSDPNKNLEGKSYTVEPCEEKKTKISHDSREGD